MRLTGESGNAIKNLVDSSCKGSQGKDLDIQEIGGRKGVRKLWGLPFPSYSCVSALTISDNHDHHHGGADAVASLPHTTSSFTFITFIQATSPTESPGLPLNIRI